MKRVKLTREVDGRWIAEIEEVPGALAYGATQEEAVYKAVDIARSANPVAWATWPDLGN